MLRSLIIIDPKYCSSQRNDRLTVKVSATGKLIITTFCVLWYYHVSSERRRNQILTYTHELAERISCWHFLNKLAPCITCYLLFIY